MGNYSKREQDPRSHSSVKLLLSDLAVAYILYYLFIRGIYSSRTSLLIKKVNTKLMAAEVFMSENSPS